MAHNGTNAGDIHDGPGDNGARRDRDPAVLDDHLSAASTPRLAAPGRSYTEPTAGLSPAMQSRIDPLEPRSGQHELQPITPRSALAASQPVGFSTPAGGSSSATVDVKPSLADAIKKSVHNAKPGRNGAKKVSNELTWKVRMQDRLAHGYQKVFIEGILRRKPLPPTKDGRHVPLNPSEVGPHGLVDERSQKPYIDNFIRSSRYTIYDFVPKQLVFQFSKLGNFYFLVMGSIQAVPGLSTIGRWTTLGPLAVFITFSMAKEGYDDYRRYQLDKSENRSMTWILAHGVREGKEKPKMAGIAALKSKGEKGSGTAHDSASQDLEDGHATVEDHDKHWMHVQWQSVQVGDVVRLSRNDGVPADMVLLHATGPNAVAYIETMALDGETNLKAKQACPLLAENCTTTEGLIATKATVVSEDPNIDLYTYDGKVTVGNETLPLSLNNVIYRGSTLRNTTTAIGLVINSGEETKIRMNANRNVRTKRPAMQSVVNYMVLFQIVFVLLLGMGLTIGYYIWADDVEDTSFYLVRKGIYDASVTFKEIFLGYLIMFNTLIPLSLYVSLEIIKLGQLYLLQDPEMYDPVTDTPMVANTTTILENLGQVNYVISDKTGTLTENMMRFRKMSVAGVAYLHDMDIERDEQGKLSKIATRQDEKQKANQTTMPQPQTIKPMDGEERTRLAVDSTLRQRPIPARLTSNGSISQWKSSVRPNEGPQLKTEDLLEYIRQRPNTTFSRKAKHFIMCIALCHTCLPEIKDDGEIAFQAASPDELALVEAARDLGLMLIDRPAQAIKLQSRDANGTLQTETYQVLDVIEFSSKRKRMSIIIRMPDGRICIFCKGADNVIMSRLKLNHMAEQTAKDIGRKAHIRREFEQDKATQRMSVQISTKSTPRTSFALKRTESNDILDSLRLSISRQSTDVNNKPSRADGVASWLHRRQTEEMATPRGSIDVLRNPTHGLNRMPSNDNLGGGVDESVAANEAAVFEKCFQHVDDFATEGLRTLLYAYRYIDEDTYAGWKQLYREAETSLVDRQERIEEAAEKIEQKFELAGATAIEDKLQEGVPETIDKLRRANIKVWMLTGDKRETAINIGHSARVCKPFSEIHILDATLGNLMDTMKVTLNNVGRGMSPHSVLVVDGQTLAIIDADDELSLLFYDLVILVDSVICCRASPSQKANLVKSIRRYVPKSMTLAIGDGANDIGMIQASHVGIGISGREGLQAARISDYSIAQFRFLQKLLLVHGRWNYIRTGKYVLATFWKETFFYLIQAHFQRFNGYSGTSLVESWSLTLFNSVFTSLPVIFLGVFDKDLQASTLLAVPELYTFGQQGRGFSFMQFFGWSLMGIASSFIVFYFVEEEYRLALFTEDTNVFAMSTICFTVAIVFINIKLL